MASFFVLVAVLCDRLSTTTSLDIEHQKHVRAKSQRVSCITSEVSHEAMVTVVPASLALSFAGNTAMSPSFHFQIRIAGAKVLQWSSLDVLAMNSCLYGWLVI